MTSGLQPPSSGAPTPVQGVTGGPAVLGGQISNDPGTGNVVVAPNPGQVLQVRKGSNPTALQVYEYFHTNTDYSRISLNSAIGGPFQLAVETAPSTVIRSLTISANGGVFFPSVVGMGAANPSPVTALYVQSATSDNGTYGLIIRNSGGTVNLLVVRGDGNLAVGQYATGTLTMISMSPTALGFFGTAAATKQVVTGAAAGNTALDSLLTALVNYGLITNSATP